MFERYTEKARRAIFFARYETSQVGSPVITPELLLLGLLREGRNLMDYLRIDREELERRLRAGVVINAKISTSVDIPLDDACERVLAYAVQEADQFKQRHIGTEHLLLGIMREECGASQVLHAMGTPSVDEMRKSMAASAAQAESQSSAGMVGSGSRMSYMERGTPLKLDRREWEGAVARAEISDS